MGYGVSIKTHIRFSTDPVHASFMYSWVGRFIYSRTCAIILETHIRLVVSVHPVHVVMM